MRSLRVPVSLAGNVAVLRIDAVPGVTVQGETGEGCFREALSSARRHRRTMSVQGFY